METACLSLLFSRDVAFDLKCDCRHAALTSHGISSAARANAGPRGGSPSGSDGGPAPCRRESVHLFGQIPGFEAVRRAAAPSSGRTHLVVRLTGRCARPLTRFWPEMANMATWKAEPGAGGIRRPVAARAGDRTIVSARAGVSD